jgi:outer membrane protein assembly factor BamD
MKRPLYRINRTSLIGFVCLFLLLSGCASKVEDKTYGMTEQQISQLAQKELQDENFKESLDLFEKLQARYPLGSYAVQAQLQIAYINYRQGDLSLAISSLDRFQKMYPKSSRTDYALYLRGLVYLSENSDVFYNLVQQDVSERDSIGQQKAFDAWKHLVEAYPNSPYTKEVAPKLKEILFDLIKNEVNIASYYAKRGAWVAAINRAKFAIETYPMTQEHEKALEILMDGYKQLGFTDLYQSTKNILVMNFPNNRKAKELL